MIAVWETAESLNDLQVMCCPGRRARFGNGVEESDAAALIVQVFGVHEGNIEKRAKTHVVSTIESIVDGAACDGAGHGIGGIGMSTAAEHIPGNLVKQDQ